MIQRRSSYAISPLDETPVFYEVLETATALPGRTAVAVTDGIICDGVII